MPHYHVQDLHSSSLTLHDQPGDGAYALTGRIERLALVPSAVRRPNVTDEQVATVHDPDAADLLRRAQILVQHQPYVVLQPADARLGTAFRGATLEQRSFTSGHSRILRLHPKVVAQHLVGKRREHENT